jgi:hypothetical protein
MATDRPITRSDIEAKLREIQRTTETGAEAAKGAGVAVGAAGAAVVVVLVFLLGRRSGKKRRTIVEVRRI